MTQSLPLDGIRIIAVEQYGAGPYGTQLLADLGAEVIKVEDPSRGGDVSRSVGPFFLGEGDSEFFQTFSLGKKSVTLNLKTQEGREDLHKLVKSADAVANNLRGDLPKKLGLDYESLKQINPKIVCAHLSAYGRENERAGWPGYDYLMQAEGGFTSMTGEPDGPPVRFGLSVVDFHTGSHFALGLVSALLGANKSGQGCDLDVCLFDTAIHQLSYPGTWYLNNDHIVGRLPRGAHPAIAPSQFVKTSDGWAMLMCQTPKFWNRFCEIAEADGLRSNPLFADIASRHKNLAELTKAVDTVMMSDSTENWMKRLGGKVPFAPVYDIAQALDNPFAQDMIHSLDHPEVDGKLRVLASPFRIDGKRPKPERAPQMGEHSQELLGKRVS